MKTGLISHKEPTLSLSYICQKRKRERKDELEKGRQREGERKKEKIEKDRLFNFISYHEIHASNKSKALQHNKLNNATSRNIW